MVTLSFLFPNHLTFEVAWHAGDMNPAAVTLPYQLREAYLPRLLHLLYDLEQPTMVSLLPALLATGYRVNDRHFTRRQVQLIFEYLGDP